MKLKRSVILVLTVTKNVNFKLSGEDFFMISISKIMVPLYFPSFLLNVDKCARVLVTCEKFRDVIMTRKEKYTFTPEK